DDASEGKGRAVFISGEAGIGKTRLVNELKELAGLKDFQILTGYSLGESLTPYMPFLDALRSGGLESLFTEESPRVEAVYLVTHAGLLVKEVLRGETKLSPDIFASMLTTVGDFVRESMSKFSGEEKEGVLSSLGYENYEILIESGKVVNLVVILTGEKNEFLISDMRGVLVEVSKAYEGILENWDGDDEELKDIEELLQPLITSGRYDGVNYGKKDPEARRNLLFENVSLGIIRHAQETPTLVCIEDLQWADPSSLALMHYVARNSRKTGMLMIGTYRPEDVAVADGKGHPLTNIMQLMDREEMYEKVELSRLPEETMGEFLHGLLGENDLDADFRKRVYKETEGNPLFMIQLISYLLEENVITSQNERWALAGDLENIDIPSRIFNVITRRLSRLEREQRRVADFASVIGEVFTSRLLAHALEMDRVQLLEHLRALEHTHRLIRIHNGGFRFDHAKVKEVLCNEIPEELRREYHSIIARSIEELNKDDLGEVIGDLAFHYYQSKNNEKALFYLRTAAQKAKENYSNEEAIRFLEHVLELEEGTEASLRVIDTTMKKSATCTMNFAPCSFKMLHRLISRQQGSGTW
ncbi:MAG: AAA family ATPase, partial [Thermoplasmata archaeon]|nr:AAA family ATPase [Thermoplasmata archaeon]